MSIYEFLVIAHIIGTVLGVGGATFAEIHLARFGREMGEDARKTMATTYTVMRMGLLILALSGFGFLLYYRLNEFVDMLLSPTFLAKMSVVGVLLCNAIALQARLIPLEAGAAISFASWYAALILGVLGTLEIPYLSIMMYYGAGIVITAFALHGVRAYAEKQRTTTV